MATKIHCKKPKQVINKVEPPRKQPIPRYLPVVEQAWSQSDRWNGLSRDGFSLHLTENHRKAFIKQYNDSLPEEVPDEYSFANGSPTVRMVSQSVYNKIRASKNGIRVAS